MLGKTVLRKLYNLCIRYNPRPSSLVPGRVAAYCASTEEVLSSLVLFGGNDGTDGQVPTRGYDSTRWKY
eukprot:3862788-Rhodomonas_salina.2